MGDVGVCWGIWEKGGILVGVGDGGKGAVPPVSRVAPPGWGGSARRRKGRLGCWGRIEWKN